MYKIIALDLDGTLLDKNKTISDENKQAIKEAQDLGAKILIATGRPYNGVKHIIKELNLEGTDNYVMCYNGGLLYHIKTNEAVYTKTISGYEVKRLYQESKELNVNIHAFTSNQDLITPKPSQYTDLEANINKIDINYFDFENIRDEDLFIKAMLIDPKEKLDVVKDKISSLWYENYSVVRSAPYFLEFLHTEAQKGLALLALADLLNIDHKDTIAFGDAENDLSMIEMAGLGVCMENGMDSVKKVAGFITKNNNDSGVAYAINKFVLNK